ncbi:hypothetical protein COU54_05425 [Candidatus Pacearchaeota archaeon CG10_big_fil_rev_8_21_14_0_10_31_24]|nr:MAG: hypothetical protein COU54_05425 [Candidatus Pacearchaeota archaeon CG10_big_fil_rev_8_21_14_0_10_31_24]
MDFNEKNAKKFSLLLIILITGVLGFIIIRPVLFSVIGALILAYLFMPIYSRVSKIVKSKNLAALLLIIFLIAIIILPIWLFTPIMVQQVFSIFQASQSLDVQGVVQSIFPTSSEQFIIQASVAMNSIVSKVSSASLNFLIGLFLEAPTLLLNFFIICFVFFFALRDGEKLKEFMKDLSPFNQSKEKIIVKSFKDITDAVIYGQIIIGLVQGALTGIGLWLFGVDNVLVLTSLATVLSIAPILGPFLIWVPVAVYLFTTSDPLIATGYVIYNLVIVSAADNLLRTYLISRKTNMSSAVILVGMIGGFFVFGILGIIIGPLIISYFLLFLKSYKDKTLYDLFSDKTGS